MASLKPSAPDDENPELDAAFFARARPAREVLPAELVALLPKRSRGQRGPQAAPVKTPVKIRLDADVLEALKATGDGWQTRINDALRALLVKR